MKIIATDYIQELAHLLVTTRVADRAGVRLSLDQGAQRAAEMLLAVRAEGRKAMVIGNGGSASIADHLHNDLTKAVGLRTLVFTQTALFTAMSNDHGYESAYQRQLAPWAEPGDLLIAISSSGASRNILSAAVAAEKAGCQVLTLSGFAPDNALCVKGDLNFHVPSSSYGPVELAHQVLAHLFTDAAAAALAEHQPISQQANDGENHGVAFETGAGDGRGGLRRRRASA
ncbi:MAG: SIS domain-containing protein [Phycisphaeraceae bacterium]